MEIKSFQRNYPIAVKLGANTGTEIITVAQGRNPDTADHPFLFKDFQIVYNCFIKTLRAKCKLTSIPEAVLPRFALEQDTSDRVLIMRDFEWKGARKQLDIHLATSFSNWVCIGSLSLIRVEPYRIFNLIELFTDNLAIELGGSAALGVSISDVGSGLLSGEDEVIIYGSYSQEIVAVSEDEQTISYSNNHQWDVSNSSQIVLNPVYKRAQTTLVNLGSYPIFLSYSNVAEIGKGIALQPQGGTYEVNRTNPYNGVISAIADCPEGNSAHLSGMEAFVRVPGTISIAPGNDWAYD